MYADGSPILRIIWTKQERDRDHASERWNAFSRLVVDGDPDNPRSESLSLVIDSTAGTLLSRWSGDPDESDRLRDEIQNLAYFVRPDPDVFVVGVGGGTDVLSALEFDANSVTGVEMNGDIIDLTHGVYGGSRGTSTASRRSTSSTTNAQLPGPRRAATTSSRSR